MIEQRSTKKRGADAAAAYMERAGICVIQRDWRCDTGRIDAIALDGDTLVVVDVETRWASRQVEPWASTPARARRIKKLVQAYIENADLDERTPWRYD